MTVDAHPRLGVRRVAGSPAMLARRHAARAVTLDAAVALASCAAALAWRGYLPPVERLAFATIATVVAWIGLMATGKRYSAPLLGSAAENAAVLRTGVQALAALGLAGVVLGADYPREYVLVGVPVAVAGTLVARWALRAWAADHRRTGVGLHRVLAVGSGLGVTRFAAALSSQTTHDLVIVGACLDGGGSVVEDVPVVDRLPGRRSGETDLTDHELVRRVIGAADLVEADTVCVTESSSFFGQRLRLLGWELADRGIDLTVAPGLVDVDSNRVFVDHAGGTTLLRVRAARISGIQGATKDAVDRFGAAMILALLAPVLLVLTVAVRLDSSGPALYRQVRLGRDGLPFAMLKFRTMVTGADALRTSGLAEANEHDGQMFKIRHDPRVTRIGRVLRRYSLDELPQLLNVLRGHMSLVGPRPPLPDEVAGYDRVALRRLHVKPGLTGLWQVSGRSDLTWDETVRLDLRYVDNWSLGFDARLLWKTGRAVVRGTGAY
jgi:exopolysaccharide biosynthesis polyprenyl glycosylphosphotransferase